MTTATAINPNIVLKGLQVKRTAAMFNVLNIKNDADCETATELLEQLITQTAGQLADVTLNTYMNLLSDKITAYEHSHYAIDEANPREVLAFYMDLHGLKQGDLSDIAKQGHISEILSGKRSIGPKMAKAFAEKGLRRKHHCS